MHNSGGFIDHRVFLEKHHPLESDASKYEWDPSRILLLVGAVLMEMDFFRSPLYLGLSEQSSVVHQSSFIQRTNDRLYIKRFIARYLYNCGD